MSDNPRDTKFQGFAKLLWDELKEFDPYDFDLTAKDSWQILHSGEGFDPSVLEEHIKSIIARRAYDLVVHVLEYAQDDVYYNPHSLIAQGMIPDLTQWPSTEQER